MHKEVIKMEKKNQYLLTNSTLKRIPSLFSCQKYLIILQKDLNIFFKYLHSPNPVRSEYYNVSTQNMFDQKREIREKS